MTDFFMICILKKANFTNFQGFFQKSSSAHTKIIVRVLLNVKMFVQTQ